MKNSAKKLTLMAIALVAISSTIQTAHVVRATSTSSFNTLESLVSFYQGFKLVDFVPVLQSAPKIKMKFVMLDSKSLSHIPTVDACALSTKLASTALVPVKAAPTMIQDFSKFFNTYATNRNIAIAATFAAAVTAAGVAYYVFTATPLVVDPVESAPGVPAVEQKATMLGKLMQYPFVSGMKAAGLAAVHSIRSMMPAAPTMAVPTLADLIANQDKIAFAGTVVGTTVELRSIDADLKAQAEKNVEDQIESCE